MEAGKPGPWLGKVLEKVVEWQLEHPEGTKEDCEQWLRADHLAGKISFDVSPTRAAPAKRGRGEAREGKKKTKVETE